MKCSEIHLRTFLPIDEKIRIVSELFPSRLAVYGKTIVLATNCLFVESDWYDLEQYVLDVIDYFCIKSPVKSFGRLSYVKQLTLF